MTDQQREKYAIVRDKLSDEQWAELEFVVDIMNRAKRTRQKTINGVKYFIIIWTDESGDESKDMRFIFGPGGWTISSPDKPLKECLPVNQHGK